MASNNPYASTKKRNPSVASLQSLRATAVEACSSLYGENTPESWNAIKSLYDVNASDYENPLLTATSRSLIDDIYKLSRQFDDFRISRPTYMFRSLFGLSHAKDDNAYRIVKIWTDVGDICETESFDGHRKSIIEHTLNILILPSLHDYKEPLTPTPSTDSFAAYATMSSSTSLRLVSPSLRIPGTSMLLPSPFHVQLHLITSLSFNEQGRITHHRDFCDVKDLLGIIPGVSLVQWITGRLAGYCVAYASRKFWVRPNSDAERYPTRSHKAVVNA